MTLTVEDGSNVADADAYVSVSDCDAYHSLRGNADWAAIASSPPSIKEAYIRAATDYIETFYAEKWQGSRSNDDQSLSWPRNYAYRDGILIPGDDIPVNLIRATCEAALLIAQGNDLTPSLEHGGRIRALTQVVGPVSERVAYAPDASAYTTWTSVERYIKPLLAVSGIMSSVVRG